MMRHKICFDGEIWIMVFSKATEPIVTKFHVEPPGAEGAKICTVQVT